MSRPFNNTKWWGIRSLVLFSTYAWGQGLMNVVNPPSFQIGTASERYDEDGSGGNAYSNTLANEFNILTPENSMKWESIQPSAGQDPRVCSNTDATGGYDWTNADALVLWAQQNGKTVRGHNLVWGNQLPSWVYNYTSESDLAAIMQCHIQNVINHYESLYQGIVVEWDVVNEPLTTGSP
jgi:endo-1,4-beta-xylanase